MCTAKGGLLFTISCSCSVLYSGTFSAVGKWNSASFISSLGSHCGGESKCWELAPAARHTHPFLREAKEVGREIIEKANDPPLIIPLEADTVLPHLFIAVQAFVKDSYEEQ